MPARPAPRRTQAQRREATVRRLLDAATEALIEEGYAGASVQVICRRAGVSHGGLFRHFPSTEALMVAVAEDLGQQILAGFQRRFARRASGGDPVQVALALLRESCRSRPNQAWYELLLAARTDPALRRALAPISRAYFAAIRDLARQLLPGLAARLGDRFDLLADAVVAVFDGEQLHRFVAPPTPAEDRARLELLAALIAAAR